MSSHSQLKGRGGWHDLRHLLKDVRGFSRVLRLNPARSAWRAARTSAKSVFWRPKTILFYPEHPAWDSAVYKLCAALGWRITTNPRQPWQVAFRWHDTTVSCLPDLELASFAGRVVNITSRDISKSAVAAAFSSVFGYTLEVTPTEFAGKLVEKSDRNASHDGRVLEGPLTDANLRPGYVYQRLLDNVTEANGLMLDYRVPIIGDSMPLVYLKYRPAQLRFSNTFTRVELAEPAQFFSSNELEQIAQVAQRMGLDFGELDILRDRDGRLYVVDVNNTPHGPSKTLPAAAQWHAIQLQLSAFERLLKSKSIDSMFT